MPERLSNLTPEQLADLPAYLQALKQAARNEFHPIECRERSRLFPRHKREQPYVSAPV
jgi:hypothetical protein